MTYFISGHRDLTWEEFTKWYAPAISKVICTDKEARFVVGDCEGADRDIAFIRKGKESSGTAQNILRRWTK